MWSYYLEAYISDSTEDLNEIVPIMQKKGLDRNGINKLGVSFRQRGACTFLHTEIPQPFFINFMQSASACLSYLKTADDNHKVTSEGGFYDAVGIGFWDCAQEIARESRMTWNPSYEYEDDFLFVLFLMKYFFLGADQAECQQIIDRHEAAAEGQDQEHRDICLSFLNKDHLLFEKAIHSILEKRQETVEKMIENETMGEESWSWLRHFSREGLALLKLADKTGLQTGQDYLHVPELLRKGPEFDFDFNAWKTIHYQPE